LTRPLVARRDWSLDAAVEKSMLWASGTTSVEDFLEWCSQFTLEGLGHQIGCPVLAVCGAGEGAESIAQAGRFAHNVAGPVTCPLLTREMGADNHVGIGNIAHTAAVVYDWLADRLPHSEASRDPGWLGRVLAGGTGERRVGNR
jgi:hypothetical protein